MPAFFLAVIPAEAGIQSSALFPNGGFKTWIPAFAGMAILFLLGFSIYAYLPIRSAKEPPLNWGQPTTVSKIARTITRKDYGSLNLALGEAPARNASNSSRHIKNFFSHLSKEVPLPALLLAGWAMMMGLLSRRRSALIALAAFLVSGPFFFLLGNLAFTPQSDGIIGRFMIFPVIALLLHLPFALERRRLIGSVALVLCAVIAFQQNIAAAQMRRSSTLALDYGRAMLRTLPANGTLFMDGGDDAFYSLAMLRYVMGARPDVELHDRGGLIFRNPYGADFRSLPKEQKQNRRWQVEQTFLIRGPLFYSTMDANALPGFSLTQAGFLMETERKRGVPIDWPLIVLRALYPLEPNDYRSRAIGVFFPFMRGRQLLAKDNVDEALPFLRRAAAMGADVDWFQNNLEAMYALEGYRFLTSGKLPAAEKIYSAWIDFNPNSSAAQSNFGVVLERLGRLPEARAQYERTAALFPQMADPVFNLAVLAWKEKDWPRVVSYLEEAVRRKPDHAQAQAYLTAAREKMRGGAR